MEYKLSKKKKLTRSIFLYVLVILISILQLISDINYNKFSLDSFLIINGIMFTTITITLFFLQKDFNKSYKKNKLFITNNSIINYYGDIKTNIPFDTILDIKTKYFLKKINNIIITTQDTKIELKDYANLELMQKELHSKLKLHSGNLI